MIVSYDLMRRVEIWKQLFRLEWDSAVCDEGHALGHGNAARTRAVYGATIYSKGGYIYPLSQGSGYRHGNTRAQQSRRASSHLSRLFPNLIQGFVQKALFLDHFCVTVQKTFRSRHRRCPQRC